MRSNERIPNVGLRLSPFPLVGFFCFCEKKAEAYGFVLQPSQGKLTKKTVAYRCPFNLGVWRAAFNGAAHQENPRGFPCLHFVCGGAMLSSSLLWLELRP